MEAPGLDFPQTKIKKVVSFSSTSESPARIAKSDSEPKFDFRRPDLQEIQLPPLLPGFKLGDLFGRRSHWHGVLDWTEPAALNLKQASSLKLVLDASENGEITGEGSTGSGATVAKFQIIGEKTSLFGLHWMGLYDTFAVDGLCSIEDDGSMRGVVSFRNWKGTCHYRVTHIEPVETRDLRRSASAPARDPRQGELSANALLLTSPGELRPVRPPSSASAARPGTAPADLLRLLEALGLPLPAPTAVAGDERPATAGAGELMGAPTAGLVLSPVAPHASLSPSPSASGCVGGGSTGNAHDGLPEIRKTARQIAKETASLLMRPRTPSTARHY